MKRLLNFSLSLGTKLAIILGVIVLISLGCLTFLNSFFIGQDVKITAEENNLSTNSRSASTVSDKLLSIRSNVFQLLDLVAASGGKNSSLATQAKNFFFQRNPDIASIRVIDSVKNINKNPKYWNFVNEKFFKDNNIKTATEIQFLSDYANSIRQSCSGKTIALNASPYFKIPAMTLLFPYKINGAKMTCVITFSIESLSEILGTNSINTTFVISDADEILSHPDSDRVVKGDTMIDYPLVKKIRSEKEADQSNKSKSDKSKGETRQILFSAENEDGVKTKYFGAYQKLDIADILVITTVPLDLVLETVRSTRNNNILLMIVIFCISTIIILFYSRYGISNPIKRLTVAASEIQNGNFENDFFSKADLERKDELGLLNNSTKAELGFLNTFAKFTNKSVAKAIARNEIDFEPHLKDVTIFFSDIRRFTEISDDFNKKFGENSPRQIITFLNDYLNRMVECITLSGGTVDKFEGDAIMAVWGIMRDEENLDKKTHAAHVKEDALNAVKGSLAMRYALMKYNKDAKIFTKSHEKEKNAPYKPQITIGRGLNTGRATAGILGSSDKMEYTAIGDAVNFASRTEASTKTCGCDMLITEDTYNVLKKDYIKCEENNFTLEIKNEENEIIVEKIPVSLEVKGKGTKHFYGVVNMPRFNIEKFFKKGDKNFTLDEDCALSLGEKGPKTLDEVRKLLGIEKPDFSKVNLNVREDKIQVKNI